jgi:hypothetical protein
MEPSRLEFTEGLPFQVDQFSGSRSGRRVRESVGGADVAYGVGLEKRGHVLDLGVLFETGKVSEETLKLAMFPFSRSLPLTLPLLECAEGRELTTNLISIQAKLLAGVNQSF